jgi:hypothetical protein
MLQNFLVAASLLAVATSATAQCTLGVTGTGAPGTSVTFAVDGTVIGGFAFLAIGDTQGTTAINFGPLGTLTLGLAIPFSAVPMGQTNLQGDAVLSLAIPATVPGGADLFAQGVTLGISMPGPGGPSLPTLSFCATNVVGFHIGS